jgi:hypothetical protein
MNDSDFRILAGAINHNADLLEQHLIEGTYVHRQETPSMTWAVKHGLGSRRPLIETYDVTGNKIGHGVNRDTQTYDTCDITFAIPMSGVAILRY